MKAGNTMITRVRSNVKGGVDFPLGARTLIVGPNASGKSRIVQSLELALTGKIDDLVGRIEVAKEADLAKVAAPGDKSLWAEVDFSTGDKARWESISGKRAKHTFPDFVKPDSVMPFRLIRSAILGSAETARKFFIQHMCDQVSEKVILDRIPGQLHKFYRSAIVGSTGLSQIDVLLSALEESKSRAREATAKAKTLKEASASISSNVAPIEDLSAIRARLTELRGLYEQIVRQQAQAETAAQAQSKLRALETKLTEQMVKISSLRQAVSMFSQVAELTTLQFALVEVVQFNRDRSTCGVCAAPLDHAAALQLALDVERRLRDQEQRSAGRNAALGNLQQAEREFEYCRSESDRLVGTIESALRAATPTAGMSLDQLKAEMDSLTSRLQEQASQQASWQNTKKILDDALGAEQTAQSWKSLADSLNQLIGVFLDQAVEQFAAKVRSYLPAQDQFEIKLRGGASGNSAVFQFGLAREGQLHSALSGAEWSRILLAMGAAISDGYTLLVPEDRGFDPATLTMFMESVGKFEGQVVIATTTTPSAVSSDWTVLAP